MAVIALDATYSVDPQPSGVAVYSRKLIEALAKLETPHRFLLCYRLSRFKQRRNFLRPPGPRGKQGPKFSICWYQDGLTFWLPWQAALFHSLAQRPPAFRFKKEIVTIHDVFPLTGLDYSTPEFQRKFSVLLLAATSRAARIITPSKYTAEQLMKHAGVPAEKVRVIPEGVDESTHPLSDEERRAERERLVGRGNEMILSVGVLQTRKNTIQAIRAVASLPARYQLVLVGGEGHGSKAIHDFVRKERLESRLTVSGHVRADQLLTLYQSASVLLFPSLEEGFGLPVLEAMANGLPVVASNTSALPEVGGDAPLYVDPHDPADIAEKTRRAVEDPACRAEMIERGLGRARQFTWRRTAEATCALYDEVLAGNV